MNETAKLINTIAEYFEAKSYLELGLPNADTFKDINIQFKIGVDKEYPVKNIEQADAAHILVMETGTFFHNWESLEIAQSHEKFDVIYLHGFHYFAKTLPVFTQSLSLAHPDTIWLMDNTVPQDPYAAYPERWRCIEWKKYAGFGNEAWQGDLFKCVFAIHDTYPEISYCTITKTPNPLTIFWQAPPLPERRPAFDSIEAIERLDYLALLTQAKLLMPVANDVLLPMIGMSLAPNLNPDSTLWKKLISATAYNKKSVFPNMTQRIFLNGYQPFLKLFSQPDAYKRYINDPSAFFASTKHPMNKAVRSLLACFGPNPKKADGEP